MNATERKRKSQREKERERENVLLLCAKPLCLRDKLLNCQEDDLVSMAVQIFITI